MKPFDQPGNVCCWCVVDFHETSSCQNPCCSFGSLQEACFPSSFDLWCLSFSTLRISGPSVLFPFPILVVRIMILKTCVWCWWAVCWGCSAPTKDCDAAFAGLVERSLVLEPHCLGWNIGGSDGEQKFCECPRRFLVTFRCLTGAGSHLESSSRGCSCLQAPDRPHVLSGS